MKHALVIIGAAQVIPALRADQLAMVAGEPMPAVGAHLGVMLDRLRLRLGRASRTGM